jgi:hypothetical protein
MISLEKYTYSTDHNLFYRLLLQYHQKNILPPPFIAYNIALFYDIFHKIYLLYHLFQTREILLPFSMPTPETAMEKAPFVAFLPRKILLPSSTAPSEQYSYSTFRRLCYCPLLSGENTTSFFYGTFRKNIHTPPSSAYTTAFCYGAFG